MVEIEIEVQCDECGAKLDASVHGNTIYVSPCECQREKITDLETEVSPCECQREKITDLETELEELKQKEEK